MEPGPRRRRTSVASAIRPDGTDLATGTLDVFAIAKNLSVVEHHCRAFRVDDSPVLAAFTDLVKTAAAATVEASCKFEQDRRHAARFNLFFHRPGESSYAQVRDYLHRAAGAAGGTLDLGPLDAFVGDDLDTARVMKVVTGIDVRSRLSDCRLKVWFMLEGYPERVDRAIALQGDDGRARALQVHEEFLVGFDLHLDGRSSVKVYPDLRPEELHDARLAGRFTAAAFAAMAECRRVHVYLRRQSVPTVLQLHPQDPDDFVERYLSPELAAPVHAEYRGSRLLDMVASCREADLQYQPVREFALYYMPAETPGR